ncbi:MAG TPA: tetratricopeptide repeat protein [Phycisphaerae bacterium]|nr:tetratricopeptide repeat protein [Phycisphaerae bacterium]
MAKSAANPTRPTFGPDEIAKAKECFTRAQELVSKKNYDYAIELYILGLGHWPEAVEEGHKPCRAAALFRGPKKVGFVDQMKYKTSGKDYKTCMLNAERLLSMDPRNIGYMEALFKNAAQARFDKTAMWIGEILGDAVVHEPKPNPARFITLRQTYEMLGDLNAETDPPLAIEAMDRAVDALTKLRALKPHDGELAVALRDVAGKLTILKGRYSSAESFTDSIMDKDSQRDLHDKDRLVQSDDRLDNLIAQARQRYEADPTNGTLIHELVDLLCRREQDQEEAQAMRILLKAYEQTDEYRYKLRAHDIYMKQLRRKARLLEEAGDPQAHAARAKQLKVELAVYKERVEQYPTELNYRFEYGRRLFEAGRYDDAIPVLQEARNEPKNRFRCSLYIGRCFFEKGFYKQAANVFREAIASYEIPNDDLGKRLHYWLGRALEADGNAPEALKIYGQLIEWDYNYRKGDVRKRIENLHSKS